MCECRRDCAEAQTLYRQSAGHAAEQSQLIKQLEGLNLDTQKVLRNQEEAHTADTSSYQRVIAHLHTWRASKVITVTLNIPSAEARSKGEDFSYSVPKNVYTTLAFEMNVNLQVVSSYLSCLFGWAAIHRVESVLPGPRLKRGQPPPESPGDECPARSEGQGDLAASVPVAAATSPAAAAVWAHFHSSPVSQTNQL